MNQDILLELIEANPWQTRSSEPDPEYVKELALDIAANGLLQAPVGRMVDGRVQLAFGHNRWAAFKWLRDVQENSNIEGDFSRLPVDIRELTDEQMADMAWAENERRRDHTPIDRAKAIAKRIEDFGWTHDQIGEHLRVSRSLISNALRLLKLPENLQQAVHSGTLSERQAMPLISLYDLPTTLQARAEGAGDHDLRPSTIMVKAITGASSDELRGWVNTLIERYAIDLRVAQWPAEHAFFDLAETARAVRCSGCDFRVQRDGNWLCGDAECFKAKTVVWGSRQAAMGSEQSSVASGQAEVVSDEPKPTVKPAAPAPTTRVEDKNPTRLALAPVTAAPQGSIFDQDGYAWGQCNISATVTWMPENGDPRGRPVVIAVRRNQDPPVMKFFRGEEVQVSGPLAEMLADLKNELKGKE